MTQREKDQTLVLLAGLDNPFPATPNFGRLLEVSKKIYQQTGVIGSQERTERRQSRTLAFLKARIFNRS